MSKTHLDIQLEILTASFYEHFKFSEDLAKYLPHKDPKREALQIELNKMVQEMKTIREKISKATSA